MSAMTILFFLIMIVLAAIPGDHYGRLQKMGWAPDVIERQLAHAERNKVRAAYNRAQYIAERQKMMQAWADYLDTLASSVKKTSTKK